MTQASAARPAVFLDRDGTIIHEVGYLDRPERVELFPFSSTAIRALNRAGVTVIVVTNQSGVARGLFKESMVETVHQHLASLLKAGGAHVDAYYYCPHHTHGHLKELAIDCNCRKPRLGMIERAVREFGIDPTKSFTVGDRWLDIELGMNMGGRGVLVQTGYGGGEAQKKVDGVVADAVANNLAGAVSHILATFQREGIVTL